MRPQTGIALMNLSGRPRLSSLQISIFAQLGPIVDSITMCHLAQVLD